MADVAAGELVTITDRGRPVAQLVPVPSGRIDVLIAAGRARPAQRRLSDLPRPAQRRPGDAALSEELAVMREAERY